MSTALQVGNGTPKGRHSSSELSTNGADVTCQKSPLANVYRSGELTAEVAEVGLGGGALLQFDPAPLLDEFSRGAGCRHPLRPGSGAPAACVGRSLAGNVSASGDAVNAPSGGAAVKEANRTVRSFEDRPSWGGVWGPVIADLENQDYRSGSVARIVSDEQIQPGDGTINKRRPTGFAPRPASSDLRAEAVMIHLYRAWGGLDSEIQGGTQWH